MLCSRAAVLANVLMLGVFWLLGLTNALEVASPVVDSSAAANTANAWDNAYAHLRRSASIRGDRGLGSKSNAASPNSASTAKSSKSRKSKSKSGSSSASEEPPIDPTAPITPIAPIGRDLCTCGDEGYTVEVGRSSSKNEIDLSALTYSILDQPSNGSASLNSQGVYTYTPTKGYRGEDVFVYQLTDANTGFTKSATVTIVVGNRAPVAVSAEYETAAGKTIEFTLQATDADVTNNIQEESDLTYTITTMVDGLNGSGNTYTFSSKTPGTYKIGFTVSDGLASDDGIITIIVTNTPPVASDITAEMFNNEETKDIVLSATDADRDGLSYRIVTTPSAGVGALQSVRGAVARYGLFNENFVGEDTFTYVASDGTTDSNVATVTIVILDPLVAEDVSYETDEGTSIDLELIASGGNSEERVPCGGLAYPIVSAPENGEVVSDTSKLGECFYTYVPNEGFSGEDSFTFKAIDSSGNESNVATITISVNSVNAIPVASDVSATTDQNTPVDISVSATDTDLEALQFSIRQEPLNGFLAESNTCNFAPIVGNPGDNGTTSPGILGDNTGTIREVEVPGNRRDLQFTDIGMGGTSTACYKYTPNEGFTGTDTFTYVASDGTADSNEATVTISVVGPPVAEDATYDINENSQINIELIATGGSDNGEPLCGGLTYDVVSGPENGILSANGMYNFGMGGCMKTYTPSSDFFGQDSFTFKATDGNGNESNVATVTINVNAIPVAVDNGDVATTVNQAVIVPLIASDDDGDSLTFSIDQKPSSGLVATVSDLLCNNDITPVNPGGGGGTAPGNRGLQTIGTACYSYTPEAGFTGTDSFTFIANDGKTSSEPATITITVSDGMAWARVDTCMNDQFCCKEFVGSIRNDVGGGIRRRLGNLDPHSSESEKCEIQGNDEGVRHRNLFFTEAIQSLVEKRPGEVNLDLNFVEEDGMLTVEQCNDLIEYLDENSPLPKDALYQDKILDISAEDLITTIGLETVQSLLDFLYHAVGEKAPVREISLRRTVNNEKHGHFIDFHTDEEVSGYLQSTVIVPIGDEENDVMGGDPWYLGHNGPVKTKRMRGKAYAHSYDVLHAVGPIVGKRMSLLIHLDHSQNSATSLIDGTGLR